MLSLTNFFQASSRPPPPAKVGDEILGVGRARVATDPPPLGQPSLPIPRAWPASIDGECSKHDGIVALVAANPSVGSRFCLTTARRLHIIRDADSRQHTLANHRPTSLAPLGRRPYLRPTPVVVRVSQAPSCCCCETRRTFSYCWHVALYIAHLPNPLHPAAP